MKKDCNLKLFVFIEIDKNLRIPTKEIWCDGTCFCWVSNVEVHLAKPYTTFDGTSSPPSFTHL